MKYEKHLEAQVESLKERIKELETENAALRGLFDDLAAQAIEAREMADKMKIGGKDARNV